MDYDPFSMEAMSDPLPIYRRLRDECPVYRLERYDAWALARFADVWEVEQDTDRFSILEGPIFDRDALGTSRQGRPPIVDLTTVASFSSLDPPVHTRLRQAVVPPLRPRSVGRLEDDVRAMARALLDQLVAGGRFDVNRDYAAPVSAAVMCRLVGFAPDVSPTVLELVNRGMARKPPGMTPEGQAARAELSRMVTAMVAQRRAERAGAAGADASPGDLTLIDGLLGLEVEGRPLTDEEISMQVRTVVNGGAETVPKVVAGGALELWRRPDQRAAVVGDDPGGRGERCGRAFEEMLRFGAPLQWVGRTLLVDTEVGGQPMGAGQRIVLLLASANRDEREFADPDEFHWDREMARHLAFGQGTHFCIGTHVARLEGRVLLEELLTRIPDYEIDEAGVVRPPSDFQVGYTSMPLVVVMAPGNRLREAWQADRPSLGAFCSVASPVVAEVLARAGFSFVVIDAQHGGATLDNLLSLIQAVELGGATPIVRVPWNDPAVIMRVLDLGAAGVIVPMVSTAADARAAAAACRYPPEGIRSFGIVRGGYGSPAAANREVLCLVMIETVEGLENTDDIVSSDGVDGIFFGPVDLSLSMGLDSAGAFTSPVVAEAMAKVIDSCRRHGRLAATVVPSPAEAPAAIELGLRMLAVGTDMKYVRAGAASDVAALAPLLEKDER